jgi:hypothetical protein
MFKSSLSPNENFLKEKKYLLSYIPYGRINADHHIHARCCMDLNT